MLTIFIIFISSILLILFGKNKFDKRIEEANKNEELSRIKYSDAIQNLRNYGQNIQLDDLIALEPDLETCQWLIDELPQVIEYTPFYEYCKQYENDLKIVFSEELQKRIDLKNARNYIFYYN